MSLILITLVACNEPRTSNDNHIVIDSTDSLSSIQEEDSVDNVSWLLAEDILVPGTADLITLSPDGKIIAAAGRDDNEQNKIWIWDVQSGKLLNEFRHSNYIYSLAWSPDGNTLASGTGKTSLSDEGEITLWDPRTGEIKDELIGYNKNIAWSPDSKFIVSSHEEKLQWWEISTGSLIRTSDHGSEIRAIGWSSAGTYVASMSTRQFMLWDAHGSLLKEIILHGEGLAQNFTWSTFYSEAIAYTDTNNSVYTLFNVHKNGRPKLLTNAVDLGNIFHPGKIAWSPEHSTIAFTGKDGIYLTNWTDGEIDNTFITEEEISSLVWFPDGSMLASIGEDNIIRFWPVNILSNTQQTQVEAPPTGDLVNSGSSSNLPLYIEIQEPLAGNETIMFSGSAGENIQIYATIQGDVEFQLIDPSGNTIQRMYASTDMVGLTAQINENVTLPNDGTYSIIVIYEPVDVYRIIVEEDCNSDGSACVQNTREEYEETIYPSISGAITRN